MCVCVCLCVCVTEKERERECVCACVFAHGCEGVSARVCDFRLGALGRLRAQGSRRRIRDVRRQAGRKARLQPPRYLPPQSPRATPNLTLRVSSLRRSARCERAASPHRHAASRPINPPGPRGTTSPPRSPSPCASPPPCASPLL